MKKPCIIIAALALGILSYIFLYTIPIPTRPVQFLLDNLLDLFNRWIGAKEIAQRPGGPPPCTHCLPLPPIQSALSLSGPIAVRLLCRLHFLFTWLLKVGPCASDLSRLM